MRKITVAIDGPAGAGKSSAAKMAAARLRYLYIDTGAMYRAVTWAVLTERIDIDDAAAVKRLTDALQIRLEPGPHLCRVYVGETEVTETIRTPYVSSHVSSVAALAVVREKLVQLQREMAASGGVILDGRDIGTVVLPQADLKIYLTASVASRARRRFLEMHASGSTETLEAVQRSIAARDDMDSHRELSPLRRAEDAILIDNSELNLDETADVITDLIRARER
ncbi:cytidylate kinase [Megasphaera cerevisiae DSM 20462]|jgi:cytidylate kinase|uniref:Cytidylate kinase n=1 Tax=Megasphaera cerevisiae DSM 20462 TaxID=1122219 RepID=A0A0J6WU34_9FIRM|nr:(d)CMP kinase [Megasphaera cerevisiae]KMO87030.1 cytidylate kinase [Megasphaera cerevisiae DSM 20462]MCI1750571.1 (d)CMP kinase [Megasphaera cerevisiae]OKY54063.1 cytidylate kinase [Megasphaera cerevisiae]SJZ81554.1 cytidylate kinase [Megasphaera cerevisiae DSM 20462]